MKYLDKHFSLDDCPRFVFEVTAVREYSIKIATLVRVWPVEDERPDITFPFNDDDFPALNSTLIGCMVSRTECEAVTDREKWTEQLRNLVGSRLSEANARTGSDFSHQLSYNKFHKTEASNLPVDCVEPGQKFTGVMLTPKTVFRYEFIE